MKRKTYWKDLLQSFTGSKGRFLSILTLMMLGSLAVVGLKVASPNMERTAWAYLKDTNAADMTRLWSKSGRPGRIANSIGSRC